MMDKMKMLAVAVDSLMPFCICEHLTGKGKTLEDWNLDDFFPSDVEREEIVEILAMADDLATLEFARNGKGSLVALTRAIMFLSAAPGGCDVLGKKWDIYNLMGEKHDRKECRNDD